MKQSSEYKNKLNAVVVFLPQSTFNVNHLNNQCKKMLIQPAKVAKNSFIWVLNKKYNSWNMEFFLKNIQQANVYKLDARKNYQRMLITHVMHIKWVNLQYLDLEDNWIQSVEMLAYLDAPEMRWINLKNNEIVQFSSLRKISFPKLRKLKLNTSSYLQHFNDFGNQNRYSYIVGRQLIRNHQESVHSKYIQSVIKQRQFIYPLKSDKKKRKQQTDSDESD